jgi:hypothetical protein
MRRTVSKRGSNPWSMEARSSLHRVLVQVPGDKSGNLVNRLRVQGKPDTSGFEELRKGFRIATGQRHFVLSNRLPLIGESVPPDLEGS